MCNKGSINHYSKIKNQFSEEKMIKLMRQLLLGLKYCHKQGIIHGNIKPSNVLISNNGNIKLGDLSVNIFDDENSFNEFKAPELMQNCTNNSFKADIWSLGVTFYFIATGKLPWNFNNEEDGKKMESGIFSFPEGIPEVIKSIISQMLIVDKDNRPNVDCLLSNPCFKIAPQLPIIIKIKDKSNRNGKITKNLAALSRNPKSSFGRNNLPLLKMNNSIEPYSNTRKILPNPFI